MTCPEDTPETPVGSQDTSHPQSRDGTESVTTTVINRILAREDVSSTDVTPLYEVIDPEALDTLFAPKQDGSRRSTTGRVSFEYQGYRVTITSVGEVELAPLCAD